MRPKNWVVIILLSSPLAGALYRCSRPSPPEPPPEPPSNLIVFDGVGLGYAGFKTGGWGLKPNDDDQGIDAVFAERFCVEHGYQSSVYREEPMTTPEGRVLWQVFCCLDAPSQEPHDCVWPDGVHDSPRR